MPSSASKPSIVPYAIGFGIYFLVGGCAALVEWAVFYLVLRFFSLNYIEAAILGFAVATYVNYVLSVRFNFTRKKDSSTGGEIALIYLVSGIGLAINLAAMTLVMSWFYMPIMAAKVVGTGTAFVWNFLIRQFALFDRKARWNPRASREDRRT